MTSVLLVLALLAQADSLGSPIGDVRARGLSNSGGTVLGTLTMADSVKLCFGDSTCDYWQVYNVSSTQFELWHTNVDGAAADGVILYCDDGTDDCFTNGIWTFTNAGLHLLDTNASHDLIIKPGSDLSSDRILTITTGDAARTFTISGDLNVESASLINQDLTTDSTAAALAALSITTAITIANTGLHVLDTNASHDLVIVPGSNLTADHNLTITTGDADRGLTLSGDLNVEGASLINQDLTSDSTAATFAALSITTAITTANTGLHVLDTDASHDLVIVPGSNLSTDRNLTLTTGDAARTVTLSGDLNVEGSSNINQDLTTDSAAAQFATLTATTSLVLGEGDELQMGTGPQYWINEDTNALHMTSTDCDGGGTDCNWLTVASGTDDVTLTGALAVTGSATATGGLIANSDTNGVCYGAAGCTDCKTYFDGTNGHVACAGATTGIYQDTSLIVGTVALPADGGNVAWVDMSVSDVPADNTVEGYQFNVDSQTVLQIYSQADSAGAVDNRRVGILETAPETTVEITDVNPIVSLTSTVAEDIAGGRESTIVFQGTQSGAEETHLAWIRAAHSGAADDEKGQLKFYVNDTNDGDTPTLAATIDETQVLTMVGGVVSPVVATSTVQIRFCGNGPDGATTTYASPVAFGADATYWFGGAGCDGEDTTTVADADEVWHAGFAFKPVAMSCVGLCTGASAANDAVVFALVDDTAAVTGMTCTTAALGGDGVPAQCSVRDGTPETVAAASAMAISITMTNDDCNDAGDDFECIVTVTF